jgi:xanthine dehydrogenase accessory factor
LGKEFRYLGLLGSKTKVEKMFVDYRKEGVEENYCSGSIPPSGLQLKVRHLKKLPLVSLQK